VWKELDTGLTTDEEGQHILSETFHGQQLLEHLSTERVMVMQHMAFHGSTDLIWG